MCCAYRGCPFTSPSLHKKEEIIPNAATFLEKLLAFSYKNNPEDPNLIREINAFLINTIKTFDNHSLDDWEKSSLHHSVSNFNRGYYFACLQDLIKSLTPKSERGQIKAPESETVTVESLLDLLGKV